MRGGTGDSLCFVCLPGLRQSPLSQMGKLRLAGSWKSPEGRGAVSCTCTAAWMEGALRKKQERAQEAVTATIYRLLRAEGQTPCGLLSTD